MNAPIEPTVGDQPRISVIVPLIDARFDVAACIGSYTTGQTFPRADYEVIALSNGSDPAMDAAVKRALEPGDRWLAAEGASIIELFARGAELARAPLLFFTEIHCLAEETCLSALWDHFERTDAAAACVRSGEGWTSTYAKVQARLSKPVVEDMVQQGDWRKFLTRGVALTGDTYSAFGGFERRFRRRADWVLGARMYADGRRLDYVPEAGLVHYATANFAELVPILREQSFDDCLIWRTEAPEFCDRYFPMPPYWVGRETLTSAGAWRACRAYLRTLPRAGSAIRAAALAREAMRHLAGTLVGLRGRLLGARLAVAWSGLVQWLGRNNERILEAAHETAVRRVQTHTHLIDLARQPDPPPGAAPEALAYPIGALAEDRLVGFYKPEALEGRGFRWSRPFATAVLNVPPGHYELGIDTAGVREDCRRHLGGLLFNGHPVRREDGDDPARVVTGRIEPDMFVAGGAQRLTLVCIPIRPRREGVPDARTLGLPVAAIEFRASGERGVAEAGGQARQRARRAKSDARAEPGSDAAS